MGWWLSAITLTGFGARSRIYSSLFSRSPLNNRNRPHCYVTATPAASPTHLTPPPVRITHRPHSSFGRGQVPRVALWWNPGQILCLTCTLETGGRSSVANKLNSNRNKYTLDCNQRIFRQRMTDCNIAQLFGVFLGVSSSSSADRSVKIVSRRVGILRWTSIAFNEEAFYDR